MINSKICVKINGFVTNEIAALIAHFSPEKKPSIKFKEVESDQLVYLESN